MSPPLLTRRSVTNVLLLVLVVVVAASGLHDGGGGADGTVLELALLGGLLALGTVALVVAMKSTEPDDVSTDESDEAGD
ncbi:hypothetical protein N0B31_03715 [Salinirubellus salinus]|uniref:Uncharacterized protein n=1 Tax=Salinirubellus salinus TaxID=1364945 RepID=A0A9E7UBR9_9EURY|nr:hypothetical protein [Salinirubellus salinus]UWM55397.1 hypothetical protein N0B31_03715 [Salinirubellus salinus]